MSESTGSWLEPSAISCTVRTMRGKKKKMIVGERMKTRHDLILMHQGREVHNFYLEMKVPGSGVVVSSATGASAGPSGTHAWCEVGAVSNWKMITRKELNDVGRQELGERIMEMMSGAQENPPAAESVRPTSQENESTSRVASWSDGKVPRVVLRGSSERSKELTLLNVPKPDVDMADWSEQVHWPRRVLTPMMPCREDIDEPSTFCDTVSTSLGVRTAWQVAELARGTTLVEQQPVVMSDCAYMNGNRGMGRETKLVVGDGSCGRGQLADSGHQGQMFENHRSNIRASERRGPVPSKVLWECLAAHGTF